MPAFAQPLGGDYQLGGGDSIRLTVFLSPELSTETRLTESGLATLPLIGPVKLGGLTIPQAEQMVAGKLQEGGFVQKAQVAIAVTEYRSQQVSVLGSVSRPGRYPLDAQGMRLTQMLATAGGITPTGSDKVIVTRRDAQGREQRTEVDVPSIYLDGKSELDVVLQGGDSVFVDRQPIFYIYGQVQRPGSYAVERAMTVGQAIAKGGSFTLRARESGVRVMRRDPSGKMAELKPRMDDPVLPDDQIFVRESLF